MPTQQELLGPVTKYYNVTVKTGTDGLTHVPKFNIPAAEVVMLKSIHGSDMVVDIKEEKPKMKIVEKRDEKGKLTKEEVAAPGIFPSVESIRDYLSQVYRESRVVALFGDPLSGRQVITDLGDNPAATDRYADQVKARVDAANSEIGASLKG